MHLRPPLHTYHLLFGGKAAARIWYYPSWWRLGYSNRDGRRVVELGPVTLYIGGD